MLKNIMVLVNKTKLCNEIFNETFTPTYMHTHTHTFVSINMMYTGTSERHRTIDPSLWREIQLADEFPTQKRTTPLGEKTIFVVNNIQITLNGLS